MLHRLTLKIPNKTRTLVSVDASIRHAGLDAFYASAPPGALRSVPDDFRSLAEKDL